MKNLMFSLAFMLIGSFAFASSGEAIKSNFNEVKKKVEVELEKTIIVKTNIALTDPCEKCPNDCCLVTIMRGGTPRSEKTCCKNIVVVKVPTLSAE